MLYEFLLRTQCICRIRRVWPKSRCTLSQTLWGHRLRASPQGRNEPEDQIFGLIYGVFASG